MFRLFSTSIFSKNPAWLILFMPRRYRRRYVTRRAVKPVKYSNETTNVTQTVSFKAADQVQCLMVGSISAQGIRKCKNFTFQE